jgi:predicted ATP-grasp superfamily ATP-dependent carboligase
VLLLDGHSLPALAFARSLGRAGVRITVAADSKHAPAAASRYCTQFLRCPSPLKDVEAFQTWLLDTVSRQPFDLLVGHTDQTVALLEHWRETLGDYVSVPLPPRDAFLHACDNAATVRLAQFHGIPTPRTHFIQDWADLEELADRQDRPLVIKPRTSIGCRDGVRQRMSVQYAFDGKMLLQKYTQMHRFSPWPLVKEYVPGTGVACFFLFHRGEVLARFQHRRIRETNPTGSGSCLRVSEAVDANLMEASEGLLRTIQWDGLVMVEYREAPDGTQYLMEINTRPWGSIQLAIEAGVDFPLLWYRAVTGQKVQEVSTWRAGVECRYLADDFRHLENVFYGPPAGWPLPYPKRLPTLLRFCKFWGRNLRYDDFAGGDWRPGLVGLRNYFAELGSKIWARFAGRTAEPLPTGIQLRAADPHAHPREEVVNDMGFGLTPSSLQLMTATRAVASRTKRK